MMFRLYELTRRQIAMFAVVAVVLTIAVAAAVYSCRFNHKYPKELTAIDSLCESRPDSAMALLETLPSKVDTMNSANKWYCRLLRVKVRDKMYIKAVNTDEAEVLVGYYKKVGSDKRLLPYAYYYLGSAYRDTNNFPMAIEYYHKALDVVDEKDLRLCSALNFQIGFLMYEQMLGKEALPYLTKSYQIEKERQDTVMMTYVLQKIGYVYRDEKSDSCLAYYNKAAELAKTVKSNLYNVILSSIATYYIDIHEYEKAKECALPALSLKSLSSKTMASYLDAVALSYLRLGRRDSAEYYYHKLFQLDNSQAKVVSSRHLAEIYRERKELDSAFRYFDIYEEYEDSMQKVRETETVAKLDAAYNYTSYKEMSMELEQQNTYMIYILVIAMLVAVFSTILLVIRRRRISQLQREQSLRLQKFKRESKERSEGYIKECEAKIKLLEAKLKDSDVEDIESIKLEHEDVANLYGIAKRKAAIRKNTDARFVTMPIYSRIEKKAADGQPLSQDEFIELEAVIKELFPDFRPSLYAICPLSIQDYHLCLLIKGFTFRDNVISVLLSRERSTISKAKKKLKTRFLGEEVDMQEFEKFIKSI